MVMASNLYEHGFKTPSVVVIMPELNTTETKQ